MGWCALQGQGSPNVTLTLCDSVTNGHGVGGAKGLGAALPLRHDLQQGPLEGRKAGP